MTDFLEAEFYQRTEKTQKLMYERGLDAILLCTEAEVRYYTGFRSLFWQSPTRPWFVIIPKRGKPIAVIPEIGRDLMERTWVDEIITWPSPRREDDGVSLLVKVLKGSNKIGLLKGEEASLRMPLNDFETLNSKINGSFIDCSDLVKEVRLVKSELEINIIRQVCSIASCAFDRAQQLFHIGQPLDQAFRDFKIALLKAGAEEVPYLVGGAGQDGYSDVISPPSNQLLKNGDILMLDTGSSLKGYFCDFDRNWAIGKASNLAKTAYSKLYNATEVALKKIRPGMTCAQVFSLINSSLGEGDSDIGRMGHGLGIQLTEYPSLMLNDKTVLRENMVMTIEPSLSYGDGLMMVHEENICIRDGEPELLTKRAAEELPVLD
ncbi:MAG: aminopeptidase P family protein [Rhodobacteraceae bacterium]|nr:MAG: aminopeptidase P family protein [Paracoccaceae bacterium]